MMKPFLFCGLLLGSFSSVFAATTVFESSLKAPGVGGGFLISGTFFLEADETEARCYRWRHFLFQIGQSVMLS
jgi:hypothetical protein